MLMYELFSGISCLIKPDKLKTQNFVFLLHSRVTVVLLIGFSIIVTASQYFGDPIACYTTSESIPEELLNSFCWITTTFSIPSSWNKIVGQDVPYPGVGTTIDPEDRVYHRYYQWVCFALYIQALFFAIPAYVWKLLSDDKISSLVMDLDEHIVKKDQDGKCQSVVNFLIKSRGSHGGTFYCLLLLEVTNAVNVLAQMFLMDRFLGGNYWSFGVNFFRYRTTSSPYDDPGLFDPLIRAFPRMTKCTFHEFGSSGDVQRHDAFCLLALNHVNEKIFIVIWFWFMALVIASAIGIIYRIITYYSTDLRIIVLQARCRMASPLVLEEIVSRSAAGDWLLLSLLAKNMDGFNFKRLADLYLKGLRDESARSSSPPYSESGIYPEVLAGEYSDDFEMKVVQPFSASSFRPNADASGL